MPPFAPLPRRRWVLSDPGRARLVNAVAVTSSLAVTALACWLIVRYDVADPGFLVVGILAALQVSTSIRDPTPRGRLITTALAGIPLLAAPAVAVLLDRWRPVEIAVFIVLAGLGAWARRFGNRAGQLGTIAFLAYFFGLFVRPPLEQLPVFLLIFAIVWVSGVGMRLVLLREHPARQLEVLLSELRAESAASLTAALAVGRDAIAAPALEAQLRRVDEVARAVTAWQTEFPTERCCDVTVEQLAERVLDVRIDVEHAALEIAGLQRRYGPGIGSRLARPITDLRRVLDRHATVTERDAAAADAHRILNDDPGPDPAGLAGVLIARTVLAQQALAAVTVHPVPAAVRARAPEPAAPPPSPTTGPHPRLRATDRQALQTMLAAALAAVVGEMIDASRWYWAVMAAFLVFVGSSTRGSVLSRASYRVFGTLLGILGGLGIGAAINGPSPWHVLIAVIAVFGALYWGAVSQTAAAFFSTLVVVALYGLLGVLDSHLLAVRLAETAAGAIVGVLCAYLLFSTGSRATITAAIHDYLDALAVQLEQIGAALAPDPAEDPPDPQSLLAATRTTGAALSRFHAATTTMSPNPGPGPWSPAGELRHLLTLAGRSADRAAKAALAVTVRRVEAPLRGPDAAVFCGEVSRVHDDLEWTRAALTTRSAHTGRSGPPPAPVPAPAIDRPVTSAAVAALTMLSRVGWALLRAADLRRPAR